MVSPFVQAARAKFENNSTHSTGVVSKPKPPVSVGSPRRPRNNSLVNRHVAPMSPLRRSDHGSIFPSSPLAVKMLASWHCGDDPTESETSYSTLASDFDRSSSSIQGGGKSLSGNSLNDLVIVLDDISEASFAEETERLEDDDLVPEIPVSIRHHVKVADVTKVETRPPPPPKETIREAPRSEDSFKASRRLLPSYSSQERALARLRQGQNRKPIDVGASAMSLKDRLKAFEGQSVH